MVSSGSGRRGGAAVNRGPRASHSCSVPAAWSELPKTLGALALPFLHKGSQLGHPMRSLPAHTAPALLREGSE